MAKNSFWNTKGGKATLITSAIAVGMFVKSCINYVVEPRIKTPTAVVQTVDNSIRNSNNTIINNNDKNEKTIESVISKSEQSSIPVASKPVQTSQPNRNPVTFWSFYENNVKPFDSLKGDLDILFVHYNAKGIQSQRLVQNLNFDGYMKLIEFGEGIHNVPSRDIGNFGDLATNINGHKYIVLNPSIAGGTTSYANLTNNIEAIATVETTHRVSRTNGSERSDIYSNPQGAEVFIDGRNAIDKTLDGRIAVLANEAIGYMLRNAMNNDKQIAAYISESDHTTQTVIADQGQLPAVNYVDGRRGGDISLLLGLPNTEITKYFGRNKSSGNGGSNDDDNNHSTTPNWNPDPTDRNNLTDEQESKPNNYNDIAGPAGYNSTQDVGTFGGGRP